MNAPTQTYFETAPDQLLDAVRAQQHAGSRLVQICCSRLAHFELLYSFSRNALIEHLRICLSDNTAPIPSVSAIYSGAFAYENEIHDLYGIPFTGLNVDYKGHFFRSTIPAPMAVPPAQPAKPVIGKEAT